MLKKYFKVDNLKYEFMVNQNTISFGVISGTSRRGIVNNFSDFDFFENSKVSYEDINLCLSPVTVLKIVSEYTLEWVRNKKPYMFSFSSVSSKKQRIFNLLVNKILNKNPDILSNYYYIKRYKSNFVFYKKFKKINIL